MQVTPGREGLQTLVNSADYYFGMGDLLREWNKLDEAEQYLSQGMELVRGTLTVYAEIVTLGYTALARLLQARGNYQGALATFQAFTELGCHRECCVKEAVGVSTFLPPKIPATDSLR